MLTLINSIFPLISPKLLLVIRLCCGTWCVFLVILCIVCAKLWSNSKESDKKEYVDLYWFLFDRVGKTGVSFPRCFVPIFSFFQKKKMGFGFLAIHVIIKNKKGEVLLCELGLSKDNKKKKYDIGVGYDVESGSGELFNMSESICIKIGQMLGIFVTYNRLEYLGYVIPSNGYRRIVYNYLLELDNELDNEMVKLNISNGTCTSTVWRSYEYINDSYMKPTINEDHYLNATSNKRIINRCEYSVNM